MGLVLEKMLKNLPVKNIYISTYFKKIEREKNKYNTRKNIR